MRNWIRDNNNQGNVLRMSSLELPEGSQTIKPNANNTVVRVLDINGAMTITIDGSESLPGDEISFGLQATAASTVSIDGDAAAGSIAVGAGGVAAVKLVNMGSVDAPFFVSYVALS